MVDGVGLIACMMYRFESYCSRQLRGLDFYNQGIRCLTVPSLKITVPYTVNNGASMDDLVHRLSHESQVRMLFFMFFS